RALGHLHPGPEVRFGCGARRAHWNQWRRLHPPRLRRLRPGSHRDAGGTTDVVERLFPGTGLARFLGSLGVRTPPGVRTPALRFEETVVGFPVEVETTVAQLPADLRDSFQRDFVQRRKSMAVAFLLWALVGAHYAYLRQRRQQLLFVFSLGGLGIWWAV